MLVGSARVSTLDQNPVLQISGLKATWCVSQLPAGKEANGDTAATEQIPQVSPVAWQHFNYHGRYECRRDQSQVTSRQLLPCSPSSHSHQWRTKPDFTSLGDMQKAPSIRTWSIRAPG